MKKPWLAYWIGDVRADLALACCPLGSEALWFRFCGSAETSPRRGFLLRTDGERPVEGEELGVILGRPWSEIAPFWGALDRFRVISRVTPEQAAGDDPLFAGLPIGTAYSRRMVEDERKAVSSRRNGKKGGRPKNSEPVATTSSLPPSEQENRVLTGENKTQTKPTLWSGIGIGSSSPDLFSESGSGSGSEEQVAGQMAEPLPRSAHPQPPPPPPAVEAQPLLIATQQPPERDELVVARVFRHYKTHHPRARPGKKEKRLVRERIADGFSEADLCLAIDGNHVSPFHCGENEARTEYHDFELILRSASKVNTFMEAAIASAAGPPPIRNEQSPPRHPTAAERGLAASRQLMEEARSKERERVDDRLRPKEEAEDLEQIAARKLIAAVREVRA